MSYGAQKFSKMCDVLKALIKYGCITFFIWCLFNMVTDLSRGDPVALTALCGVLDSLRIPTLVHTMVTVLFGGGYFVERKRVKSLIEKRGDNRHKKEHNDAVKTRSGLNRHGVASDD